VTQLVLTIIKLVVELIDKACSGDNEALRKLYDLAPEDMKTEIVAKVQDERDLKKFGSRTE
jgi:hypothetical protein